MPPLISEAIQWWQAGYTPLPVKPDGTKAPAVQSWTAYQKTRPTLKETLELFKVDSDGIGLICGAVSGGLEMLELEARAVKDGFVDKLEEAFLNHDVKDLWDRIDLGYTEVTPSGGIHIYYRVEGRPLGNRKLARRSGDDGPEVLIETRGEGGFTVIAPSYGRSHPSGLEWVAAGNAGPANIPIITADQRDTIHAIASTLDQMPVIEPPPPTLRGNPTGELRPGDDYNARATWKEILEPHGWTIHKHYGGNLYGWRKPGKTHPGISATTGRNEADRIYVFSTSTIFEAERPYSKFGAYTLLNHAGDFAAAARELRKQGYGATDPKDVAAVKPHLNGHPQQSDPTTDLEPKLETFWDARPVLQHIRDFTYARLASPWAVLGVILTRTLHHIPPWVTLPALIGGKGNFNLFIALVGPSGGGKGAAESAARDAINYYMKDSVFIVPAGSGEGLTHAYAHYENKTEGVIRDRNAVVFTSAEVDALAALNNRQGSTLMAQLRQAFSGETLGFAYADKTRKIIIEAHSYRFGYIVGVQPERAAAILDQTDGGTPQRFIWLPATDPTITNTEIEEPPPKTVNWPHPKTGDITMPDEVKQEIRDAHVTRVQGNGHILDGHAVYAREKAAYALTLLDNRIEMNQEDWTLAGQIMAKSDITRTLVQAKLQQKQEAASTAKALGDAQREITRSGVVDTHEVQEAAKAITRKLSRNQGDWTVGKAVRDTLGKRREHFHDAIELLQEAGQIEVENVRSGGTSGVRLRLSKQAR